jgi:hypothetical protein
MLLVTCQCVQSKKYKCECLIYNCNRSIFIKNVYRYIIIIYCLVQMTFKSDFVLNHTSKTQLHEELL